MGRKVEQMEEPQIDATIPGESVKPELTAVRKPTTLGKPTRGAPLGLKKPPMSKAPDKS